VSIWYERRKASDKACIELAREDFKREYARLYREYESRLKGDDPDASRHASQVLQAFLDRDEDLAARLQNRGRERIYWLAGDRVKVRWPVPVRLTWLELLILTSTEDEDGADYERPNEIFYNKEQLCIGFTVHDKDFQDFRLQQRKGGQHGPAH
jgi:hypothetical protein